jgi:antitoxin component YwqK of YwqJK toxin-antitoxin module
MQDAPERPESVPEAAVYSSDFDTWELGARDADGRRTGECCFFRADGSLHLRSTFRDGVQDGAFAMFHPDGQLAREGSYVQGELDGPCVAYASEGATTLPLRSCCVPKGAVRLESEYRHGQVVRQDFYDAEDRKLSSAGVPLPPRPPSVPMRADFDEFSWRWVLREETSPVSHRDRFFSVEGALSEELDYGGGLKRARRLFDDSSSLREASSYDDEGRLHGAFFKRFSEGESSPHQNPAIRGVRGQFEHDHPIGRYELLDREQKLVRALDFGVTWCSAEISSSPALSEQGDALWTFADVERAQGRIREGLCLAARAAARDGDRARLQRFLDDCTLTLTSEHRAEQGQALTADSNASFLGTLDRLLLGAEPAAAYRTLAAVLPGAPRAAQELVNAALLLAPEQRLAHLTRGLVRLELGDVRGVLADAEQIDEVSPAGAEFLRDAVRVYFPRFDFWPEQHALGPPPAVADEVRFAQPLAAVQSLIRVYATRLVALRKALRACIGKPSDLERFPPDLSHLLPDGPLELEQWRVTIEDETDDGVELSEVEIDERLELRGQSVTALMSAARANHAALSWLCWAVGLEEIAVPERIQVRSNFAAAVGESFVRYFSANDRLKTGGLSCLAQGVPSFSWEGLIIDSLHPRFATVLAEEYLEVRAMFLWSMWQENVSPFQADLRLE